LLAIWDFIAADNPDAADRIIGRFHEAASMLAEQPQLGRQVYARGSREFVISGTPYILLYQATRSTVHIRRVRHAAQYWPPRG
jgi:plasmid stabilization system protein ParE